MTQPSHDTFAAFVGIDWADAKHDGCLQAAGSAKRECFQLKHTPEAIDAWVTTLRTRFDGQPVAICLERNKGPLVFALRTDDFLVLFPIHPLTLARSREACTPSRATALTWAGPLAERSVVKATTVGWQDVAGRWPLSGPSPALPGPGGAPLRKSVITSASDWPSMNCMA